MKVLILGSKGQTGLALEQLSKNDGHVTIGLDIEEIDISDRNVVNRVVDEFRPTHIINAAAYNAVDSAEKNVEAAFSVNALAPAFLALAAKKTGAIMVHYSTDYIFDGEKDKDYIEEDLPNPLSVYGHSKLLGEQAVRAILPQKSYVLRTSWVFGPGGNNFVSRILKLAETRKELSFINNQLCTPTYAPDLARVTLELIKLNAPSGVYHAAGSEILTPYSWAKAILEYIKCPVVIKPVDAAQFETAARRPKRAVLANRKLEIVGINMRGGRSTLDKYFS